MHAAALAYAGARGSLDAQEQAELLALRRFRDGITGLRCELAAGVTSDDGEPITRELAVETIDALLALCEVGLSP